MVVIGPYMDTGTYLKLVMKILSYWTYGGPPPTHPSNDVGLGKFAMPSNSQSNIVTNPDLFHIFPFYRQLHLHVEMYIVSQSEILSTFYVLDYVILANQC